MKHRGSGVIQANTPARGRPISANMYSPEINFKKVGQNLRAERERIGQTQEQIADAIDVTPAFVGHLERAERSMSLNTLIKFCNYYHVTIDYLLSDILPPEHDSVASQIADMLLTKTPEQQAAILDILRSVIRHV